MRSTKLEGLVIAIMIMAVAVALFLLWGCDGSSGGGNSNPPPACPNILLSERSNPDWMFVAGQLKMPVSAWACERGMYIDWCSYDVGLLCLHVVHKFCCFDWTPEHVSMTYHFQEEAATGEWYVIENIQGEPVCDFSCPSQVEVP